MAIDIIARGMIESSKTDISQLFNITKGGETVSNESSYTLNNAVDYPLLALNLYGKSTQDGTPTPDTPVDIVSVGDSGSVTITVDNGDSISTTAAITSALPLCGIPVDSGGNYTDSNGQQWICDYVDFEKGVKVQRVERFVANEFAEDYIDTVNNQMLCSAKLTNLPVKNDINTKINAISNKLEEKSPGKLYNEVGSAFCFISSGRVRVTLKGVTTTAELNATLGEVVFIYPLATQIETPLTEAELQDYRQLQTFNGITNISNDGGADMDVKYCTNKSLSEYVSPITTGLQSQINELKAAVLSLGGNV